jgi:hypothetical protein
MHAAQAKSPQLSTCLQTLRGLDADADSTDGEAEIEAAQFANTDPRHR